ncbi:Protein PTHB1, variant 2 [Chamberlinius hualienensis]
MNPAEKIVVGGYSGILYIFSPTCNQRSDEVAHSPSINSVLLESQLALPILHIAAGKFVSSSDNICLAILHPRKLVIYGISLIMGNVDHGSQYQMGVIYEHNLERSAFSMITGPFGRVNGRDFICVLSLDGTISIFEQESYIFSRFLPGVLLPGPITYNSKTDSFIFASSSYQLESYKYQALALSTSSKNTEPGQKIMPDWSYNLGESALDLSVIITKTGASLIYILGERHIFCIKDNGTLKFMKKFEFHPTSFHVYLHGDEDNIFYMIGTHTKMALIYQDVTLKWATQIPLVPVYISKTDLQDLRGGVVVLSENGLLSCFYLGTNPTVNSPLPSKSRPINLEETTTELEKLNKIINASHRSGTLLTNKPEAHLTITVAITQKVPPVVKSENDEAYYCCLQISLKTTSAVQNVQLSCYFEKSFLVTKTNFYFSIINESATVTTDICLREGFIPSELTGSVTVVYDNPSGVPVIAQNTVALPLRIAVNACLASKDADFKLTVCLNKMPVKFDELFPDFVNPSDSNSSQVISFQYYAGPTVTILMAKTSQRYRIQSDNFESVGLILKELLQRLQKWFSHSDKEDKLICSYQNDIPLQEFYLIVNSHLQTRHRAEMQTKRLSQLAGQIRAIQKCLLLKFKDKAATPLANLDTLLDYTFKQMSVAASAMETCNQAMQKSLSSVIAASRLICLLLKLYANMSDAEYNLLTNVMCSNIDDESEQGWEEIVTAGLETLLQTTFSKTVSDTIKLEVKLKMPENIEYLKKQLSGVMEFVTRGCLIKESDEQILEEPNEDETVDSGVEEEILIGTKFGERILMDQQITTTEAAKTESNQPVTEISKVNELIKTPSEIIEPVEKLSEIYTNDNAIPDYFDEF